MKNIGAALAEKIVAHLGSAEIKQLLANTKAASDSDTGTFEVVITTENLDRYQEVIKLDGWELEHFRNNPVVLWGHNHNQPVGVATSIEITDGRMVARGKFAPTAFAQEIRALYDAGIIKATSVGFIEKEREGNLITKAELLEFSFVSVPANPYALSLALEKELSVNELVTKGFMTVERDAPAEEAAPEDEAAAPEAEAEPEAEAAPAAEQRSFSTKQVQSAIETLKAAIVALEALGTSEEPEGDDESAGEEEDEDQRAYREFSQKREIVQAASTVIGEVLAEARRAIDARKAA